MHGLVWLFNEIFALRVELAVLCPEVVVDRSALEDALLYAMALASLVVPHLHDDAEAFDEENAAKNGQQ